MHLNVSVILYIVYRYLFLKPLYLGTKENIIVLLLFLIILLAIARFFGLRKIFKLTHAIENKICYVRKVT